MQSGANAVISGDMLTTSGISIDTDMKMIQELGFKNSIIILKIYRQLNLPYIYKYYTINFFYVIILTGLNCIDNLLFQNRYLV